MTTFYFFFSRKCSQSHHSYEFSAVELELANDGQPCLVLDPPLSYIRNSRKAATLNGTLRHNFCQRPSASLLSFLLLVSIISIIALFTHYSSTFSIVSSFTLFPDRIASNRASSLSPGAIPSLDHFKS
jgi:hypothetical protein